MKLMLFIMAMILCNNANAQFAAGYGPGGGETPAPVIEAPKPTKPEIATPYQGSIRILATVNGDIITTEDVNHRVRAFSMSTGIPYNEQTKLLIMNKVMQNTIDEKLKLQEAVRNGVDISEKDIDNSVLTFAQNNNASVDEVKNKLKEAHVSEQIFRDQMKTDLAWIRLIRQKTATEKVTQLEIEEAVRLAEQDMSKPKYMVSEILLPQKDSEHIDELVFTLRRDPRFELYASQFSEGPSSAAGGQLGWISAGSLPKELEDVIKGMDEGAVSKPVLYNGQYYIFKLEKKFDPATQKAPAPDESNVAGMLEGQKQERYAEQLMQSLRQKAAIELRE